MGGVSRCRFVKMPWRLGGPLEPAAWAEVRERAIFDCCKWDIQSEDHCVLADFPLILETQDWETLAGLAEKLAAEALESEREIATRPELHAVLGLPRAIRRAMAGCDGSDIPQGAARVMRFDFHFTTQGWRISEANTDVPGGFIEGSGFARLMAEYFPDCQAPPDVAEAYVGAIASAAGEGATAGLVHATAHSDDRQVMEFLGRKLERLGVRALLLSPAHLRWQAGRAGVVNSFATGAGDAPAVLVRFFPGEWLPLLGSREIWKAWFCGGTTAMSNPGTALLVQSKRFPLTWQSLRSAMTAWKSLLPETVSPREVGPSASMDEWVYKPVLGRVGEDIAIAGVTEERLRRALMKDVHKHSDHWVAQRRFESVATESSGGRRHVCLGVFTVDGRTAGIYGRISAKALIDQEAQDIAVLIAGKEVHHAVG
jgi:glutathionylspermidine synthase